MKSAVGTLKDLAGTLLLRSKNARDTLFGHHFNQSSCINRAAQAKAWGLLPLDWMLPPKDWPTPFTQASITIDDHHVGCALRWLKWLWIPATAAVLGGVTYLIYPEVFQPGPPVPPAVPVVVKPPVIVNPPGQPGRTLVGDADVVVKEITVRHREDR